MRKYARILLLLLPIPIVLGATTFVTSSGQDKKPKKQSAVVLRGREQAAETPTEQEVLEQLPIVEAFTPEVTDPEIRIKRQRKNARHDNLGTSEITEAPYPINVVSHAHWWQGLAALPFAESDVVLLGEINDSHAYLSNDRTGVYSEFTVQAEEVFKNQDAVPVMKGSVIMVERWGGAVRFPSGAVQRYTTTNQRMPLVGRRYLLFLKRIDQDTFSLITGYELKEQRVMPLDGSGSGGGLPFDIYKATEIDFFLDLVRASAKGKESEGRTNQ